MFNSVISDLQQVQSRYETAIATATETIRSQVEKIETLRNKVFSLEEQNQILSEEVEQLGPIKEKHASLSSENTLLYAEIYSLKNTLKTLEEDQKSFMKISHLAALDKENARLRQELELALKKNVVSHAVPLIKSVEMEEESCGGGIDGGEEDGGEEDCGGEEVEVENKGDEHVDEDKTMIVEEDRMVETEDESAELDVYEKKINGRIYYVSRGDDRSVYMRNDDDSIGSRVGSLVKIGDKYKMSWINGVSHQV